MKNREIVELYNAINTIIQDEANQNLDIKTKFKLGKNLKKILDLYSLINEQRDNIIKKYGIAQDDNSYKIPNDKIKIATQELDELLNIETYCNLDKIDLSDLENSQINIESIIGLMPIINETPDN